MAASSAARVLAFALAGLLLGCAVSSALEAGHPALASGLVAALDSSNFDRELRKHSHALVRRLFCLPWRSRRVCTEARSPALLQVLFYSPSCTQSQVRHPSRLSLLLTASCQLHGWLHPQRPAPSCPAGVPARVSGGSVGREGAGQENPGGLSRHHGRGGAPAAPLRGQLPVCALVCGRRQAGRLPRRPSQGRTGSVGGIAPPHGRGTHHRQRRFLGGHAGRGVCAGLL